jgi:hypothetical protein
MLTQVVRGRTGDRTSSELVVSGTMNILHPVHVLKCVPLRSVAMFGKCETTRCGELPRIFAWSYTNSHFKNRLSFFILKKAWVYALYARDNDEKDGRPIKADRKIRKCISPENG